MRITDRIATLDQFISPSSERFHKSFAALNKNKDFDWTPECQQTLRNLNKYLSNPPLLSKPRSGELAILEAIVSVVLVREDIGTQSVTYTYYVSKAFIYAETRYPH